MVGRILGRPPGFLFPCVQACVIPSPWLWVGAVNGMGVEVKGFLQMELSFLISWLWVNKKDYPGWAWPNQMSHLKEDPEVRESPSSREALLEEANIHLTCFCRVIRGRDLSVASSNWEHFLAYGYQEKWGPGPTTTRYWFYQQSVSLEEAQVSANSHFSLAWLTCIWTLHHGHCHNNLCCFKPLKCGNSLCSNRKPKPEFVVLCVLLQ